MQTNINIQNLKCGGCGNTITKNLIKIEGVSNVNINTQDSVVSLEHTNASVLKTVKETLIKLGYPDVDNENKLSHKAKSFVSCAVGRINK